MKITTKQLKQLIKEELKNLKEQDFTGGGAGRPILSRAEMQQIDQCRSAIQDILQRIVNAETHLGGAANAEALRAHIRNLVAMQSDLTDRFHGGT